MRHRGRFRHYHKQIIADHATGEKRLETDAEYTARIRMLETGRSEGNVSRPLSNRELWDQCLQEERDKAVAPIAKQAIAAGAKYGAELERQARKVMAMRWHDDGLNLDSIANNGCYATVDAAWEGHLMRCSPRKYTKSGIEKMGKYFKGNLQTNGGVIADTTKMGVFESIFERMVLLGLLVEDEDFVDKTPVHVHPDPPSFEESLDSIDTSTPEGVKQAHKLVSKEVSAEWEYALNAWKAEMKSKGFIPSHEQMDALVEYISKNQLSPTLHATYRKAERALTTVGVFPKHCLSVSDRAELETREWQRQNPQADARMVYAHQRRLEEKYNQEAATKR